MTAFFILYYAVVRARLLEVAVPTPWRTIMLGAGLVLMVVGAAFNVLGRVYLKSNWANQIKIYEGHWLVTTGPFAIVRHPLYASLIWMLVGGALVYANLAGLVLTLAVFVPMMYGRAKKEEALLTGAFGEQYAMYRRRTGMFLPKIPR
jgi:protein-S-isoprenylcysteine O-methyltransferase Ste14